MSPTTAKNSTIARTVDATTSRSNLTPRSNSSLRARPSGPSGESATIVTTATTPAHAAMVSARATLRTWRSRRVIPSDRSSLDSADSRVSWRITVRPTNATPARIATPAKTRSALRSRSITRRIELESVSTTGDAWLNQPPGAVSRRASNDLTDDGPPRSRTSTAEPYPGKPAAWAAIHAGPAATLKSPGIPSESVPPPLLWTSSRLRTTPTTFEGTTAVSGATVPSIAASRSSWSQPASRATSPAWSPVIRAASSLSTTSSGAAGSGRRPSSTMGRAPTAVVRGVAMPESRVSRPQWFDTVGSSNPTTKEVVTAVPSTPGCLASTFRNSSARATFTHCARVSAWPCRVAGSTPGGQPWNDAPTTPATRPATTARNTDARQCARQAFPTRILTALNRTPRFASPVPASLRLPSVSATPAVFEPCSHGAGVWPPPPGSPRPRRANGRRSRRWR